MSSPRLVTVIFGLMADHNSVGQPLARALDKRLVTVEVDVAQAGTAFEQLREIAGRNSLLVLIISSGFLELPESAEIDKWLKQKIEGMRGRVVALWDNVSAEDVAARMPFLATLSTLRTDDGIERCADSVFDLTDPGRWGSVEFSVFHPTLIQPDRWFPLPVYVHTPGNRSEVEADSRKRGDPHEPDLFTSTQADAWQEIVPGTEVRIVPTLAGCLVQPASHTVVWNGAWQRVDFMFQWLSHETGPPVGVVFFFVGAVLVGEIPVRFEALLPEGRAEIQGRLETGHLIQRVFVSYSRNDTEVVDALEPAYRGLGIEYLRDLRELRAGQECAPELLTMIDRAEAFQLFWSVNAKESEQVEREWRHALKSVIREFIRPVYWEEPLAQPPQELAHLRFIFHPGIRPRTSLSQWMQRIFAPRA